MERETTKIITPVKAVEVELYTYITGREAEAIQAPLLKAMKIRPDSRGKDMEMSELDTDKIQESNHAALKAVVKTVGGKTEDVVNTLLDMPSQDYDFVVEAVDGVTKKK
jgi:hypothetical protein